MNKKKSKTKKFDFSIKSLMAKKGVYITLLTLIIVLGTAAVIRRFTTNISVSNSSFSDEAWEQAVSEANISKADEKEDTPTETAQTYEEYYVPEITSYENPETAAVSNELSDEEIIAALSMMSPCPGSIIKEYSPDKLIYSKSMKDWRAHMGIDIASPEGSVVAAAADGVVEEVYEDDNLGVVVLIGHGGGVKTLYGNLQDLNYIEVGRQVAKGDTIGAIGSSSVLEGKDKSHLHFEVIKDGENKNPTEYIPL